MKKEDLKGGEIYKTSYNYRDYTYFVKININDCSTADGYIYITSDNSRSILQQKGGGRIALEDDMIMLTPQEKEWYFKCMEEGRILPFESVKTIDELSIF